MTIHRRLEDIPFIENLVLTIGTFDGIHKGHQELIQSINHKAREINGQSGLITFHPHPRQVLQPNANIQLLTTLEERIEALQKTGLDHLFIVPFSADFSNQTAEEYIEEFLVKNFHPKHIVIGYDHKFGKGRTGNIDLLDQYKEKFGYQIDQISQQKLETITYSSTNIRQALQEGNIKKANQMLGYNYRLTGIVSHGEKIGRTLGYPTANIKLFNQRKLIPQKGVYAVKVDIFDRQFDGMLNIGNKPTFDKNEKTIEVHLFNFSEEIYGHQLTIEFLSKLRNEQKFNSKEELINQLKQDEQQAREILNK